MPLSDAAIDVLKRAHRLSAGKGLIFPGAKRGKPLSDMTMLKLLRDRQLKVTAHGFRSSFRDWAADETDYPAEVAEAALAHAVSDAVVARRIGAPTSSKSAKV